ncbi:MAG: glutamine synthetase, partial [Gammaproteobacteria bacterium]|nr:glutamine synthetase [Gammaproteobacteria bacterium]
MSDGDLAMLGWCDLGSIVRTRPVPLDRLDSRRRFGMGYATAGVAITPFDGIVENPWGPMDEMRLVPVEGAEIAVAAREMHPAMHLHLSRALAADGTPGEFCPRNFCQAAVEALEAETGWTLWSAFEHEFTVIEPTLRFGPVYSVQALRSIAPFVHEAVAALRPLAIECFEPEFGHGQFEASFAPAVGVGGADRAVLAREVLREVARRHALRITFSPKPAPEGVGSGMHVHFSFRDRGGRAVLYDPRAPATVSADAASFIAGVIRHIGALTAIAAPSPVS